MTEQNEGQLAETTNVTATAQELQVEVTKQPETEDVFIAQGNDKTDAAEQQEIVEEDYSNLQRPELIVKLETIANGDDIMSQGATVKAIRTRFFELQKEENEKKRAQHLEAGGLKEDFSPRKDELDQRFDELIKKFNQRRTDEFARKEKQLADNLFKKKKLIDELKTLLDSTDTIGVNFKNFQDIQTRWRESGPVAASEINGLRQTFTFLADKFFDQLKLNRELQEINFRKNTELKTTLCERAEKLIEETSIRKALVELRMLQEQWKDVGYTGKESNELIWQRFKDASNKVFDRRKDFLKDQEEKLAGNLEKKKALCEKLEGIAAIERNSHQEWQIAKGELELLWEEWKKVGPVPESDQDTTWKHFKQIRQNLFETKDNFYKAQRSEQQKSLDVKTSLCEQAEALKSSTDWGTTSRQLIKLQEEWKASGPAPRAVSDKLWKRFRGACDEFFNAKKENFAAQDAEQAGNVTAKEELIARINAVEIGDDMNTNLQTLKALQNEWLNLGKVSGKEWERLRKDYNTAVETLFGKIRGKNEAETKAFNKVRYEQLTQSREGQDQLKQERNKLQGAIRAKKEEVQTLENNLTFFKTKGAESLKAEYEVKINDLKRYIAKLEGELKDIPTS